MYREVGVAFYPTKDAELKLHEKLPTGNWIIKVDMFQKLFFEAIDPFVIPEKIYGDTLQKAQRILNTYQDRSMSTGVLLTGEKGSGKTLLAKMISKLGKDLGYPTVVINSPYCGDPFNELIQGLHQSCVIIFDEFEKVYDKEDQQKILTLLDGVFPTKKLFIFTCNDKYIIDVNMYNRPGRIFYSMEYGGLDSLFIIDYCNDTLKPELRKYTDVICQISSLFYAFNFDMLKAMIEEMNRYNESPQEVMKFINASPSKDTSRNTFKVELIVDGIPISEDKLDSKTIEVSPLNIKELLYINYNVDKKGEDSTIEQEDDYETFSSNDLKKIETEAGKFFFVNSSGNTVILTKFVKESLYTRFMA